MIFITDDARKSAFNAVTSHIKRKDSLLITGPYGAGKTSFLQQIKNPSAVRVSPLGGVYQILGRMCKVYDASPMRKDKYLDQICDHPRTIIIDEAQHLPEKLYPYLKIIMDAGNTLIMAGLPDLHDNMRMKHPDVLSRMSVITLPMLGFDDLKTLVPEFEEDAFSVIYGSTDNTRSMMTIIKNCRDYAASNSVKTIGVDVVMQFIAE